jgi:hypothetical protein
VIIGEETSETFLGNFCGRVTEHNGTDRFFTASDGSPSLGDEKAFGRPPLALSDVEIIVLWRDNFPLTHTVGIALGSREIGDSRYGIKPIESIGGISPSIKQKPYRAPQFAQDASQLQ